MARKVPNRAYFEFDAQPAMRVVYTLILERHRNIISPYLNRTMGEGYGGRAHIISDRRSINIGANMNEVRLEKRGVNFSLINNFMASAIGWRSPANEILLGPLRIWDRARIFRSNKVKNAIEIRAMIIVNK